jgi:integrase
LTGSVKKRGEIWRARVRIDGREIARHFKLKAQAEAWVQDQAASARRGEWVDPRAGRTTVQEYAEDWARAQTWRRSTRTRQESMFRLHVFPALGRRQLAGLRRSDLQAWVNGLQLAPATAENLAHVLGGMLRSAVRDRIIPHSPMDGVSTPRVHGSLVTPLATEEVAAIVQETPERWRALVMVGAGCGLRIGEATGLDLASVDFLRRRLRVTRQLITPNKGEAWAVGPPKTRTASREIPLPSPVTEALALHLEHWPEVTLPFGGLIFTTERGQPIRRQHAGHLVSRAARRAIGRPVRFHELRHHYASLLIAAGLSVKAVQSALGHATAAETLDTYGHLWPAEGEALAGAVERAWLDATLDAKNPPASG